MYDRPFFHLNYGIWLVDVFLNDGLLNLWLNLDISDDPGAGTLFDCWLNNRLLSRNDWLYNRTGSCDYCTETW